MLRSGGAGGSRTARPRDRERPGASTQRGGVLEAGRGQPETVSVEYHPAVEQDVAEALRRYDAVSQKLGEEFQAELRRVTALAAAKPGRFHLIKPGFHRAN